MPVCLITGANRGIGLEFVRQYAADEWSVIATCRKPDEAAALQAIGGDVRLEALDVGDFARIEALGRKLDGQPIDLLLHNAGLYGPRVMPFDRVNYAAWTELFRINVMAPLKLSAVFVRNVAWSQRKTIVGISSSMGSIGGNTSGGAYAYRSSKAALNAVMRSLAIDLRPKEITVAVVNPGWVRTEMGGPGARIAPRDSVAAMRAVIDRLTPADSGRFFDYQGAEIPW